MRNAVALHGLRRKFALLSVVMVAPEDNGAYAHGLQGTGQALRAESGENARLRAVACGAKAGRVLGFQQSARAEDSGGKATRKVTHTRHGGSNFLEKTDSEFNGMAYVQGPSGPK